jgi:hypothetical protein
LLFVYTFIAFSWSVHGHKPQVRGKSRNKAAERSASTTVNAEQPGASTDTTVNAEQPGAFTDTTVNAEQPGAFTDTTVNAEQQELFTPDTFADTVHFSTVPCSSSVYVLQRHDDLLPEDVPGYDLTNYECMFFSISVFWTIF